VWLPASNTTGILLATFYKSDDCLVFLDKRLAIFGAELAITVLTCSVLVLFGGSDGSGAPDWDIVWFLVGVNFDLRCLFRK
jgi:hypothetical protein